MTQDEMINALQTIQHKQILSEPEAALYMGRSVSALRALRYQWKIPFLKDGRKIQYRKKDLDAYLDRKLVPAIGG